MTLGQLNNKWAFLYGKESNVGSWLTPFHLLLEENSLEVLVRSGLAIAIPVDLAAQAAEADFSLSSLTMLASKLDHQLVAKHTLQQ